MSRHFQDLEAILAHLIAEHRRLLEHVTAHEAAMRSFDLKAMDAIATQQQACRLRIAGWEEKRKSTVAQIARTMRVEPNLTLSRLADLHPPRREMLLRLRAELKGLAEQIAARTRITSRIASAVLGHLNTAARLLAGAVGKAGVYTKQGTPQVARRIGVMEAVG
jgi:hypothetical protein